MAHETPQIKLWDPSRKQADTAPTVNSPKETVGIRKSEERKSQRFGTHKPFGKGLLYGIGGNRRLNRKINRKRDKAMSEADGRLKKHPQLHFKLLHTSQART